MSQIITQGKLSEIVYIGDPATGLPIAPSSFGGGGTAIDRELVVTTYIVTTAFTGASVGDTITQTQIIDVSGAPSTVSTVYRNQTTQADLASPPSAANLALTGTSALTNGQLRASPVPVSISSVLSTQITNFPANQPVSLLSSVVSTTVGNFPALQQVAISGTVPLPTGAATETTLAAASAKLPTALGQKASAASLAVTWASDQTLAVGAATGANQSTMIAASGAPADAVATTDTGTFAMIPLQKRLLTKIPALVNGRLPVATNSAGNSIYQSLSIAASNPGDNTIIPATAGLTIRVYLIDYSVTQAGTVQLKDSVGPVLLHSRFYSGNGGGLFFPEMPSGSPYFTLTAGAALVLNLGGSAVGRVWYTQT